MTGKLRNEAMEWAKAKLKSCKIGRSIFFLEQRVMRKSAAQKLCAIETINTR